MTLHKVEQDCILFIPRQTVAATISLPTRIEAQKSEAGTPACYP